MSNNSPGGKEPPDIYSEFINSLTQDSRFLLNSLHQISPLQIQKLDILEKEIQGLTQVFVDNNEILEEIKRINNKITMAKNKKLEYAITDFGPFIVIVEARKGNVGNIHPLDLGKILFQLQIKGIKEIQRKGANRISVEFTTSEHANDFLKNETFEAKGYVAFIPQRLLTSRGIIRNIGMSVTMEDIVFQSKTDARIISARRLNRRVKVEEDFQFVPTGTVQVTFENRKIPKEIKLFAMRISVEPYIAPIQQCHKCLRFGHSRRQCRGKLRCPKCGENHDDCNTIPKCLYCDGNHLATNKQCKEFERQKNINETMAFRELSYYEATQIFPPIKFTPKQYIRQSQDFPILRRPSVPVSSSQKEYSKVVSTPKRRKNIIVEKEGYDMEAHRAATIFPSTSRMPNNNTRPIEYNLENLNERSPYRSPERDNMDIDNCIVSTPVSTLSDCATSDIFLNSQNLQRISKTPSLNSKSTERKF